MKRRPPRSTRSDTLFPTRRFSDLGLLIGPVSQAALLLDRLLSADLLSKDLLQQMQAARALGGPIPGRPWITPGYGLGVMQGSIDGGFSLCGHTGGGPGSVIAVYRICDGDASVCCAAIEGGASEGTGETFVVGQLLQDLRTGCWGGVYVLGFGGGGE